MPLVNSPFHLIHFDVIDSTNTYAKQHLAQLHHFDVIDAACQTHGRGRSDHQWLTTPHCNLTASLVLKEPIAPHNIQQLTQVTALSILKVCEHYQLPAQIKFPNDIYVHDKKIAGILIEAVFDPDLQGIIIGTGINVREEQLLKTATSFLNEGLDLTVESVRDQYLTAFAHYYSQYLQGGYPQMLELVNQKSWLKQRTVIYQQQPARIGELQADGQIEVIFPDRTISVFSNAFTLQDE